MRTTEDVVVVVVTATYCKHDGYFECDNGRCIVEEFVCDGHKDCGVTDDSDERNCTCEWHRHHHHHHRHHHHITSHYITSRSRSRSYHEHIISYHDHIISYHIISYHIISYHIMSYHDHIVIISHDVCHGDDQAEPNSASHN